MTDDNTPRALRADTRPLYLQLVDALCEWIKQEDLRPGDRVPGEPELARMFGVGRSTVREALVYLDYEGVVKRSQGLHTTLTSLLQRPALGLEGLVPVEELASRQGWECRTVDITVERGHADDTQAVKLHLQVGADIAVVRRTKATEEGPFALMESVVPDAVLPFDRLKDGFEDSMTKLFSQAAALRFAEAEITAIRADGYVADALAAKPGSPVLLLEELYYGDGEDPLSWNLNYFVPGAIRMEILRKVTGLKRSVRGGERPG